MVIVTFYFVYQIDTSNNNLSTRREWQHLTWCVSRLYDKNLIATRQGGFIVS